MKKIKIVHLYPDEMNLYGDSGNVLCLYNRLARRSYKSEIVRVGIGDKIPNFDIMFIGGGQDREMQIIKRDLKRKSATLSYYVEQGKTVLAICGGYQILGDYYKTASGEIVSLSSCLPFYTVSGEGRMVGNTVFSTSFGTVVGFENHASKTYLSDKLKPFGTVVSGFGNNGEDKTEGLLYKNTFCTYAHGPVLPKNPALADEILKRALKTDLQPIDDKFENLCHDSLVKKFG